MSPSRKSAGRRSPRGSHALHRHISKAEPASSPRSRSRPLVDYFIALEAVGWRVVEIRPPISSDEGSLWRLRIDRVDFVASMTATAPDPDVALAELVRYASADATEQG